MWFDTKNRFNIFIWIMLLVDLYDNFRMITSWKWQNNNRLVSLLWNKWGSCMAQPKTSIYSKLPDWSGTG
jgi:hypothetical protein